MRPRITILTLVLVLMAAGAWAHDLRPGESVRGETAGPGSTLEFTMEMAAGDSAALVLTAKGGGDTPSLEILSPRGLRMAGPESGRRVRLSVTAAETGTHLVRLVAGASAAPRFVLKVRGEMKRRVAGADGEIPVAGPDGAEIRIKVKGGSWVRMLDADGAAVALEVAGSAGKLAAEGEIPATGDYSILYGPEGAKATVKIVAPAPRGAVNLPMAPPAPPAASPPVAGGGSVPPPAGEITPPEGGDGTVPPEGEIPPPGDGTVSPPAPPAPPPVMADYSALRELLASADDESLLAARAMLAGFEEEGAGLVAALLEGEVDDADVAAIRDSLARHDVADVPAGPAALDRMIQILGAARRAEQAGRCLDVLAQEIPGTGLAGDAACEAAFAEAQGARAALLGEIGHEIEHRLPAMLRGEDDPEPSHIAAEVVEPSAERIAGLKELDRAVLSGNVLLRARSGDADASALIGALYRAYDRMLAAMPQADPDAAQIREALRATLAELEALEAAREANRLEVVLAETPMAVLGRPCSMLVRVLGADDQMLVSWDYEEAGMIAEQGPAGLHLLDPCGLPRDIRVRASFQGREGEIRIRIEPRPEAEPRHRVVGRVVDAAHQPIAGARYELREVRPDGQSRIAVSLDERLLHGETDGEGRLELTRLPEGHFELVIRSGESEQRIPLPVEPAMDRIELLDVVLDG